MPGGSRSLPDRPNLRYLRLQAKRRLGWLLSPRGDTAMHSGGGYDATAYLTVRVRDNRTLVVLTSRMIPVNTIADRLLRSWT
jgi:hypothetical protein